MTDADWLVALVGTLDNAAERAAYADWLDDAGDPRAEAVRLDLHLCGLRPGDPTVGELRARLAELVAPLDVRWRAAACRVPLDHGEPAVRPRGAGGPPGPWYTLGCACAAPYALATDLFRWHDLAWQPDGPDETWRVCFAALACEGNAIRYGGRDPAVLGMLGNHPAYCDFLIRDDPPGVHLDRQPETEEPADFEVDVRDWTPPDLPAVVRPPALPPLRLDVKLGRLPDDAPAVGPIRRRLAELASGTDPRWRAATCRVPVEAGGRYDRGFCECDVPEQSAPALFVRDAGGMHELAAQPDNAGQVAALVAVACGCRYGAVRYGGTDPVVIRMLGNTADYCDHLIPAAEPRLIPADLPPDPRGVAYVAAAYSPGALRGPRAIDRLAEWAVVATVATCLLVLVLWVLLMLLGVVLHLFGK